MANTEQMTARLDYPASKAMKQLTLDVRVTGAKVARWRLRAGAQVMRLAAAIMGCGIEIEVRR